MDFYEALIQYEDVFGESINKNLNLFEKEIKELSYKDDYHKNTERIINNNVYDIINEIKYSKNLKQLLQMKYNLSNKNKYCIYAKDILKKKKLNNFNQKGIINYNIKPLILSKDIIEYEIRDNIKKNIKEKFLYDLLKEEENKKQKKNENENKNNNSINNKLNKSHSLTERDLIKSNSKLIIRKLNREKFKCNHIPNPSKKSLSLLNNNLINQNEENSKRNLFLFELDDKNIKRLKTDTNKSKNKNIEKQNITKEKKRKYY